MWWGFPSGLSGDIGLLMSKATPSFFTVLNYLSFIFSRNKAL